MPFWAMICHPFGLQGGMWMSNEDDIRVRSQRKQKNMIREAFVTRFVKLLSRDSRFFCDEIREVFVYELL